MAAPIDPRDEELEQLRRRVGELEARLGAATAENPSEDLERLRRVEAELRRSETLLVAGQELSATGSYLWQLDTDEFTYSEQVYRIFEFDPGQPMTSEMISARVHPDDRELLHARRERIRTARDGNGNWYPLQPSDIRFVMPDGRVKYVQSKGRVIRGPDGRRECVGCLQDVTQQRLAEAALDSVRSELAHAARAMSLGTLTASIAHELNQPLSGIVTNAAACHRMLAASPPNVPGALETARRSMRDANRAADVIAKLRALFGKKAFAAEPVDLNQAAQEVITLCARELQRRRIQLRTELDDQLSRVTGDRVQLQQVVLNLLLNACDSMRGVDDRQRTIVVKTWRSSKDVSLSVQDAGVGFAAENADRLFEAFYTTKSSGMGIGLSVSRSIVESHGGRLWGERNEGWGATFSFSIPVTRRQERSGA